MHDVALLKEVALLVALAVVAAVILGRLRLPVVAGLLAAGALAGPHGLGLVTNVSDIEAIAEIGVILLLFSIGLEFSIDKLRRVGRLLAVGGLMQVGLTVGVVLAVCLAIGMAPNKGIAFGMILALSSTVIVLRLLGERSELDAPHGMVIFGILIFQDLAVVPMVLLIPLLAEGGSGAAIVLPLLIVLLKALALIAGALLVSRFVLPRIFAMVDAARSRELFLLSVLAVCLGLAYLSHLAGLSLALGAFLAGLTIAGSDYAHRALGDVMPLRDILASLFFISLGMLFDWRIPLEYPLPTIGLLLGILIGKGLIAMLSAMVLGFPARAAWLAGVGLAQFGEFGYVLARSAQNEGLISGLEMSILLAAGLTSMFLTPLLITLAPHIRAGELALRPLEKLLGLGTICEPPAEDSAICGHVVIVGFGISGQRVARELTERGIEYMVIDLNAETVRRQRSIGQPIFYGDITAAETQHSARLDNAKALVLMVNDYDASVRALSGVRHHHPHLAILMRARYMSDRVRLMKMGATDVVVEEEVSGEAMAHDILEVLRLEESLRVSQVESELELADTSR